MKTQYRWVLTNAKGARMTGSSPTPEGAGERAADVIATSPRAWADCELEVYEMTPKLIAKSRLQGGKITVSLPINSQK